MEWVTSSPNEPRNRRVSMQKDYQPRSDISVMGAAWRQENPVYNAIEMFSAPEFSPQSDFDWNKRLSKSPLAQSRAESFYGIQSDAEWDFVEAKVQKEVVDRQALASAGIAGMGAMFLAGLASPTILLPGGAVASGARGVARTATSVASWAAIGVGIDEIALQGNQIERTKFETLAGIGTAAVLGGVLGSAVGLLSARQIRQFESDMVGASDDRTIQAASHPQPVGAQVTEGDYGVVDPGGVAPGLIPLRKWADSLSESPWAANRAAAKILYGASGTWLSPVTRNLNQKISETVRWMQANLSTGGLYTEAALRGEAAAFGGDIEHLTMQWYRPFYEVRMEQRAAWRDYLKNLTPGETRMNPREFEEAIGRALQNPDGAANQYVKRMADEYRSKVFLPMLREAEKRGMFQEEITTPEGKTVKVAKISQEEAMTYFPRMIKQGLAARDYNDLQLILKEHYEEKMLNSFSNKLARFEELTARDEETLADISAEDAAGLRAVLEREMAQLPDRFPEPVRDLAEEIRDLRAQARAVPDKELAKQLKEQAADLEKGNKELLADFSKAQNRLRKRFSNLDNTKAGLKERESKLLSRIEDIEDQQKSTMLRAAKRVDKLIAEAEKLGPRFDAEVEKVKKEVERAFAVYVRGEEQLDKLRKVPEDFEELVFSDVRPTDKISRLEMRQQIREEAIQELDTRLAQLEDAPQDLVLDLLRETRDQVLTAANNLNNRRALRIQKLRERAALVSPEAHAKKVDDLRTQINDRRWKFMQDIENSGGKILARTDDTGQLAGGARMSPELVDYSEFANTLAHNTARKLMGNTHRASTNVLLEERGPELARTLDIDVNKVWSNGRSYAEFLEWDAERVVRRYIRSMAPDLELLSRFGSVQPLASDSPLRSKIFQEFNDERAAIKEKDWSDKRKEEELLKLGRLENQTMRDLEAQIDRLRHHRGVPDNPEGMGYRMGRLALNLNTLRLMGSVTISSVPDLARVVMKQGITNTFRHSFLPMITNLQGLKMSKMEAQYAGTALDLALHGRSSALFDVFDEVEHGTMFERAIQTSTNYFGRLAGFDYWNVGLKTLTSAAANANIMKALHAVSSGKGTKRDITFLAGSGIDERMAIAIWKEIIDTPGGGNAVNGVYLPNTQFWKNEKAIAAYRAALARQVDDTIITPGLERPLWMDANMGWRLVAQFRSFTMSSTQKMLIAAGQDARIGNVAPVIFGTVEMLGLGMLSYYLWALSRGGQEYEEMMNADLDKWADEAILRSGVLGVLGEVQRVAERVPGLDNYATLSGTPSSRSPFNTPITDSLGPTYGLIEGGIEPILMTMFDEADERTTRSVRTLTPFQNHAMLARGFDMIEKATNQALGFKP